MAVKTKSETFFNYTITHPDGKVETELYKSENQYNEASTEAKKVGAVLDVTKRQTFDLTYVEALADIPVATPNEEVAVGYYNYGVALAQQNARRDYMRDATWQEVEGAYPLIGDVQEPRERKAADPMTKSRNSLKALWAKMNPGTPLPTDDEINAVLSQFAGAGAAVATVSAE